MLLGSVASLLTRPANGGLVNYLATTFMVLVMMPGVLGLLIALIGETPKELRFDSLIARWFRWCVVGPFRLAWWLISLAYRRIRQNAFGGNHVVRHERRANGQRRHRHHDGDEEEEVN